MKKTKKHKLFGRRRAKRMMAVIMAAVMAFSCLYGAAPSASAKASLSDVPKRGMFKAEQPSFKDKFKATGVKRLTAYKNHLVDKVVTGIANDINEATDTTYATEILSWVNTWVLGKSPIKGTLAAINSKLDNITKLCNDILKELDEVERQLDSIDSHLSRQDITDAKERLDEAWRRDGDMSQISSGSNSVNYEGVGKALNAFLAYMEAAQAYTEAAEAYDKDASSANKSSLDKAETLLEKAEEQYTYRIFEIYTNGKHVTFSDGLRDDMYTSYDVGDQIVKAIEGLSEKLCGDGITDTYTDYAAQYAYLTKAFTDEQYDFVNTCMQRQLLQICNLEIMYQDYLSRQNDYLLEHYGDDEQLLNGFRYALEIFAKINDEFSIAAANRMEQEIRFDPSSEKTIHLYTYLTSEDTLFYENDRNVMKGTSPVIQKGVLDSDGTVHVFWFTGSTHEADGNNDSTNKTLRGMHNFEKEVIYTGRVKARSGLTGVENYAGDLVLLKLGDLYPDNLNAYEEITFVKSGNTRSEEGNTYYEQVSYLDDDKNNGIQSDGKADAAKKLRDIRQNTAYCSGGKNWGKWIPALFDTNVFSANEAYTPQSYLAGDKDLSPLMSGKDGSLIKHLFAGQYYDTGYRHVVDTSYYWSYWHIDWMDMGSRITGDQITKDRLLLFMGEDQTSGVYDYGYRYFGMVDTDKDKPFGEDILDIYCPNYDSAYEQSIRVKNSSSVRINGQTELAQVSPNGTVTLSFDKKSGDKVPVAVKYYHSNALGDNFTESKLYQDGEVIVDYDEMQALLELDPDADTVEMEIPVRYALNTAYEVVYEEPVGDLKNLEISTDRSHNKFTLSFDKNSNAEKIAVYIARDEDFEDIIQEDIIDVEKDFKNSSRISKTYSLTSDEIRKNTSYVRVQGYNEREYGRVYGKENTAPVLSTPEILEAAMTDLEGNVQVKISGDNSGYPGSHQIQFSPAEDNFGKESTTLTKTMEGGLKGTFQLTRGKHYYVRARETGKDAAGKTVYGPWGAVYKDLYTEIAFDSIENIQVENGNMAAGIAVTAAKSSDPMCEGYRFVAFSENVPQDKVMEYFAGEDPQIDEEYQDDIQYIEIDKTGDLTQSFVVGDVDHLDQYVKWNFFVEIYLKDENGNKIYSDEKDNLEIAEIDLRPHVGIADIQISSDDKITVKRTMDYTSDGWKVEVIDHLDGDKVYAEKSVSFNSGSDRENSVDSVTVSVPRKDGLEVRMTCWRNVGSPVVLPSGYASATVWGSYETSSGYQSYVSQFLDLNIIESVRVVGPRELVLTLRSDWDQMGYSDCTGVSFNTQYLSNSGGGSGLYAQKVSDTEYQLWERSDFDNISWGRYRISATPYTTDSGGKQHMYSANEVVFAYTPPAFEGAFLLDPQGTGKALTEGDYVNFTVLASVGEPGDIQPDALELDEHASTYYAFQDFYAKYDEKDSIWSFDDVRIGYYRNATIDLKLRSRWNPSANGKDYAVSSNWLDVPTIDMGKVPEYADFSEWLEANKDGVTVNIYEDPSATSAAETPAPKQTTRPSGGGRMVTESLLEDQAFGLNQSPKSGTRKQASAAIGSGRKYLVSVSLPENTQNSNKPEFDGISIRVTSDEAGDKVIAHGYEVGRELIVTELNKDHSLEEGKSCYLWLSPFNFGDDEAKVILNAGYAGPFQVTPHASKGEDPGTGDSGQDTPAPDAGTTPTPDPGITDPGTGTTGNATPSGLSVGQKATAGKGAAKAIYKATGKNTVTYVKSKAGKYAGTVTVPATVKINGKKYKVTKIAKSAFKGYESLRAVIVKPTGLTKKKVTGCLKGTSVETVQVPKKQYKKYKKIFTKKVTKSKVKVTVKKSK